MMKVRRDTTESISSAAQLDEEVEVSEVQIDKTDGQ